MITKADWEAVREELKTAGAQWPEEPPTADELLAYTHGALPPERASQVREFLAASPEIAHALTEPFPEAARPGEPGYLSEDELKKQWMRLEQEIHPVVVFPSVRRWRMVSAALAACLVLAFGGLLQQAKRLREPRLAWEYQVLLPDGQRGGRGDNSPVLVSQGDEYFLVLAGIHDPGSSGYRVELVSLSGDQPRVLWHRDGLHPREDNTFAIAVPRSLLTPGRYQVVVRGSDGIDDRLPPYVFRVR